MSQIDKVVYLPILFWFLLFFVIWYLFLFTNFITYIYSVFKIRLFYIDEIAEQFFVFVIAAPVFFYFFIEFLTKYFFKLIYNYLNSFLAPILIEVKIKYMNFYYLCFPR